MNLETLKARNAKPIAKEWNGETVYLRKLSARDGAAMMDDIEQKKAAVTPENDSKLTIEFHAKAISKSVCDECGNLTLDTDEGRETLAALPFDDLVSLGVLVLETSGMSEAKKN
jgi:hypothetical protein